MNIESKKYLYRQKALKHYYDNIECVKLLLAAGANTDIKDEVSMVHCAILLS